MRDSTRIGPREPRLREPSVAPSSHRPALDALTVTPLASTQTIARTAALAGADAVADDARMLAKATIMLVDDARTVLHFLNSTLEEHGYQHIISTSDSRLAYDLLAQHQPDLVLLDVHMPEVTGFDILERMRKSEDHKHTPVIILTGATDTETRLNALQLGATDFLSKPVDSSELILRVRNTLAAKAYRDRLTYYDALTGLPNRRLFYNRLNTALQQLSREPTHNATCAVLHIDLDRFKEINDSLGLRVGDVLLQHVAARLESCIRGKDRTQTGLRGTKLRPTVSRLGGDEFTVLLPAINESEDAARVARRILRAMESPFENAEQDLFVPLSIGIALCTGDNHDGDTTDDGIDPDALLKQADVAMYHAKKLGQNRYQFYSTELNAKSFERLSLANDLRRALEREELVLSFQPKVLAESDRVASAEALLRWQHPKAGLILPDQFIALAEETDQIIAIGQWVLFTACEQAKAIQSASSESAGLAHFAISVNVSSQQFRDPEFTQIVGQALSSTGLDPASLTLELTEGTAMDNAERSIEVLQELDRMGVRLSIDDFGTGYSSLAYLRQFPLHELKIDRSFIVDMARDREGSAIVTAIIGMAHALGLRVVAEGVETSEQAVTLTEAGCDELQGFLYSPAVDPSRLVEFAKDPSKKIRTNSN